MKKGCLWFIGIFFLLGLIGSCMGPSDDASTSTSTSTSSSSNVKSEQKSEKNKVQEYTCDVEGVGKVKGAFASDVGIAIYGIGERNVIGDQFFNKKAQGKFLIISVVVSNKQKDAITVDSSSFKLVSSDGVEYSYSSEAEMALAMENGGNTDSFLREINPGITVLASIPFDIPKDINIANLKLEARGGFTGKKVLLPLMVQLAN